MYIYTPINVDGLSSPLIYIALLFATILTPVIAFSVCFLFSPLYTRTLPYHVILYIVRSRFAIPVICFVSVTRMDFEICGGKFDQNWGCIRFCHFTT